MFAKGMGKRDVVVRPPCQRAESIVIQTTGGSISLRGMSVRSNWAFRNRCISSMPQIVTAPFRKRLKPSIALILDLMWRWSCWINGTIKTGPFPTNLYVHLVDSP